MKERQVIATWYTPDEKLPADGMCVLATVNAHADSLTWVRSFMLVEYDHDQKKWYPWDAPEICESLEIIAWCDIETY